MTMCKDMLTHVAVRRDIVPQMQTGWKHEHETSTASQHSSPMTRASIRQQLTIGAG
jgi:hypothetical protein